MQCGSCAWWCNARDDEPDADGFAECANPKFLSGIRVDSHDGHRFIDGDGDVWLQTGKEFGCANFVPWVPD